MNERTKQLYEQAHIERRQEYFSSVVDPTIKSVSVTRHFDPNLFAELIVAECIEIVEPCRCGCRCEQEVAITDSIITDIKEHFGVTE